jgi:hypothetical protein
MKKLLIFLLMVATQQVFAQADTTSTPPRAWRVTWPDGFGGKILVDTGVKLDTIYARPLAIRRKKK